MSLTHIIDGVSRNLSNIVREGAHVLNAEEQRFVTAATDGGAIHTFIVDVDHVAHDAETLLKWVETTRAVISASNTSDRGGPTPVEVAAIADDRHGTPAPDTSDAVTQEGGVY